MRPLLIFSNFILYFLPFCCSSLAPSFFPYSSRNIRLNTFFDPVDLAALVVVVVVVGY
jgi:hypothetical protein